MKKQHWLFVLFLIGVLTLSACGASAQPSGGGAPAPSTSNDNSTSNSANNNGGAQPAQPTAAPSNNTSSSGDQLDLSTVDQGLDTLDSYISTFTMGFDGTEDGQPKNWSMTSNEEFSKNPPAKHTVFSMTGTGSSDTKFETIEVNGKSYSIFGDTCASSDSSEAPTASNTFTPASVIGNIQGSQLVGAETINGIPTQHFKVDMARYSALGLYTNAASDVWVATPGGYVVKYTFQATGQDAFFGGSTISNTEGTITWNYELNNVNQPVNITAPDNCGGAQADIPILPDATNQSSFGGTSTYTSATAFNDAVNFYKTQMVANGWTEDDTAGMSAEGFASLSFKKDTQTASITISFDSSSNETTVLISVSK